MGISTDSYANRCVICGEVIPEGWQVCPNCRADVEKGHESSFCEAARNYEEYLAKVVETRAPTNLEVIIYNLMTFKMQQDEWKADPDYDGTSSTEDEYGSNLMWQVDCHPVFKDGPPCLQDERGHEYGTREAREDCIECKARWLYELCL